jgi:hypothetical protein
MPGGHTHTHTHTERERERGREIERLPATPLETLAVTTGQDV